jgi:hypothetical protein
MVTRPRLAVWFTAASVPGVAMLSGSVEPRQASRCASGRGEASDVRAHGRGSPRPDARPQAVAAGRRRRSRRL